MRQDKPESYVETMPVALARTVVPSPGREPQKNNNNNVYLVLLTSTAFVVLLFYNY